MELSPRYDGSPIISIEGPPDDQRVPVTRQRERLEATLLGLSDEQWGAPTRCDGWTVQDVVAHMVSVNSFWETSVRSGVAGNPTRFLDHFDPAATPELIIAATRSQPPSEVRDQFVATNAGFLAALAELDDAGWSATAESPAGHVPIRLLAFHALWDCWIHERDIALPLGLPAPTEADEVSSCLRYASALSPAFAISIGTATPGTFVVDADEPDVSFTLEVGDSVDLRDGRAAGDAPCLRGHAVDLVEALSIRGPLPDSAPREWRDLLGGLETVFDSESVTS